MFVYTKGKPNIFDGDGETPNNVSGKRITRISLTKKTDMRREVRPLSLEGDMGLECLRSKEGKMRLICYHSLGLGMGFRLKNGDGFGILFLRGKEGKMRLIC